MSFRTVLISSSSVEVLFEGCLMKAPPLNRRGRKKWHERYFVLKANRTLECHKTKKAAGAQKSPRRIVDLRECINLEIGLEYKSLKHIMSLGTFKRTFFYAAPSDPLMLQWADVLEKAKNAKDGEFIEVLDIGLRKTKDVQAVHTVKTSPSPSHSYVQGGSPKRSPGAKSGMALAHFSNGSAETVDLRNLGSSTNPRQSTSTSEGSRSTSGSISRYPSITSEQSTTSGTSSNNSPVRTMSGLGGSPKANRRAHSTGAPGIPVTIPNKVPPPSGFLVQASRDKDGFFVNHKRKDYRMFLEKHTEESSSSEQSKSDSLEREFVAKEGNLKRHHVVKGQAAKSQHPKAIPKYRDIVEAGISSPEEERGRVLGGGGQRSTDERGQRLGDRGPEERGQRLVPPSHQQGAAIFHSNLKRSFRYRKIALRKEFESPLFASKENSDSEDECDENLSSSVPGPSENMRSLNRHAVNSNLTTIPDEVEISNTDLTTPGPHIDTVVQRRHGSAAANHHTTSVMSYAGYSPGNSYSKVTVAGPRRNSSSTVPGKRPLVYVRSNSLDLKKKLSAEGHSPATTPHSVDDSAIVLPPPMFAGENRASGIDSIDLPARPPSDGLLLYGSCNSLDQIVVDPPDMFSSKPQEPSPTDVSPKSKRKLSRTRKYGNNSSVSAKEKVGESTDNPRERKGSSSGTELEPTIPKQSGSDFAPNKVVPDRDSTESSDTGYTSSSASPGYAEGGQKHHTKLKYPADGADTTERKGGRNLQTAKPHLTPLNSIPSLNSLNSISSDTSRFYVPLVFHSPRVEGAGVSQDPTMFSIQVCLVENSDELIKDLVTLKSLESFSVMESDEIHGMENVAAEQVDDFTVETSLQDLEFGFSVIKSTQKDLFMRKVRQFTFQIKNLFGTSKPFSCDVEIRHADQLTVLPIEVM